MRYKKAQLFTGRSPVRMAKLYQRKWLLIRLPMVLAVAATVARDLPDEFSEPGYPLREHLASASGRPLKLRSR